MAHDQEQYRLWRHSNGFIYVMWTEEAGEGVQYKSCRVTTRTKDWSEAERFRAQFIARLDNPPPPKEPTLGYLMQRYRNEHGVNTRSLTAIDYHIKTLDSFFGMLQPEHVSNNLFKRYAEQREASPGTILRELGTLKAALKYAEGNRWIAPLPSFRMPVAHPPPRDIWLTREQVELLIRCAKSPHMRLFIQIALATAARSGAILELKWEQVNFELRLIDFGRGWGNKRRATVPMNDELYESLLAAHQFRQSDNVIEYCGSKIASIKSGFRRLCQECNITASPHVLRHTAATWLVMEGVPLAEVARLLGDSERTVEKVYGKHAPDYLRRAVDGLNLNRREAPKLQL